jgi:hypothetical protein
VKTWMRSVVWMFVASIWSAGCATSPAEHLAGAFVEDRYVAPDGSWSVEVPFSLSDGIMSVIDGSDGTGGYFLTWGSPIAGTADVWVAPVESVTALGGIEKLADTQSANLVHEVKANDPAATLRVLDRSLVQVHGRAAVRHVYELDRPSTGPTLGPLRFFGTSAEKSLSVVDVVDFGDAIVRFTGTYALHGREESDSYWHQNPVNRASRMLDTLEATFERPPRATKAP